MVLLDSDYQVLIDNVTINRSFDSQWIEIKHSSFDTLPDAKKERLRSLANSSFFEIIHIKNNFGVVKNAKISGSNFDDQTLRIYFSWV